MTYFRTCAVRVNDTGVNTSVLGQIASGGAKRGRGGGGGGGGGRGAAPLQGRQLYFYYTNRGAHIHLTPGRNTPCSATETSPLKLVTCGAIEH